MTERNIYAVLSAVRDELQVPKGQRNNFGGYNFRSCEDINAALAPLCKEHKCGYFLNDEIKENGGRFYVEATATFYLDEGGEVVKVSAYAREEDTKKGMDAAQITGSCSSYARKYALCGLFAIDGGDDPDKQDNRPHESNVQPRPVPPSKRERMIAKIEKLEKQCIDQGVKADGMASYLSATFGGATTPLMLDDQDMAKYGKYLAQLAKDSAQVEA